MHNHPVIDHDEHFTINPVTRMITPDRPLKIKLMQNDLNSEQYTFDMPRFVDGHDMQLCTEIKIHYINLSADKKSRSQDVYDVKRIEENTSKNTISFSWLLGDNTTRYPGTLNFSIEFLCKDEDGEIVYRWQTDVYTGIAVFPSLHVDEVIVEEYSDILEQWRQKILGFDSIVGDRNNLQTDDKTSLVAAINEMKEAFDQTFEKALTKEIEPTAIISHARVSMDYMLERRIVHMSTALDTRRCINAFEVEKGKKYRAYFYTYIRSSDDLIQGIGISKAYLLDKGVQTASQYFVSGDYKHITEEGYHYIEFVANEDGYLHLTYSRGSDVAKLYGEGYVIKQSLLECGVS